MRPPSPKALLLALVLALLATGAGVLLAPRLAVLGSHRAPETQVEATDRRIRKALKPEPKHLPAAERTDVAVIIACTLRRDRLQVHGHERPTSPFLLALGRHGVVFENAVVQAPWTRPSVGSLISGAWPEALGLADSESDGLSSRALPESATTLAERLSQAGYHTIGVSGNPNVSTSFGMAQGFDVYLEPRYLWRESHKPPPEGASLVRQALAEVERVPRNRRLYLQMLLVDTHAPRTPSAEACEAIGCPEDTGISGVPSRLLRYDAAVRTLDDALATLFVNLRRQRPDLLFVVIGDHGEGLHTPYHHGQAHGNYLYTSTTLVPFILYHPGLPHPGRRVEGLTMGLDLVPTTLDLLGLPAPRDLPGTSQAPAILGAEARSPHRRAYTGTRFRSSHRSAVFGVVDGEIWHLIRNYRGPPSGAPKARDREFELYRATDPLEMHDLSQRHDGSRERLLRDLRDWEREMQQARAARGDAAEATLDDQTLEQLEVLGYVGD